MASGGGNGRGGGRLKSWKEIASFFGTDERTVRRWEERGLPVHRVPGGARATIYAEAPELEAWLRGRGGEGASAPTVPAPRRRVPLAAAGLLLVALTGGAAYGLSHGAFATAERHQPPRKAADLYLAGTYHWEQRTPQSLASAVDLFGQAIAEDPSYADAYAGLANTYLLLREYSGMPDSEAYPKAREAAQRALALDPDLSQAQAALAFVTFFWTRDWRSGIDGFEQAIRLDRSSAGAWHWYGTALYHEGRVEESLRALGEAQRLEPTSRSIVADRALVLFHAGKERESIAMLRQLSVSDPEFYSPHAYLADIYLATGDYGGWLREAQAAAKLKGDKDQLAMTRDASAGREQGGDKGMLLAVLADQERLRRSGRGSDYELAGWRARLGDGEGALRLLASSNAKAESAFVSVRIDPRFRGLQGDARFKRLAEAVEEPPPRRS
jgi:tetratricopeptide (TPR) repeat protein